MVPGSKGLKLGRSVALNGQIGPKLFMSFTAMSRRLQQKDGPCEYFVRGSLSLHFKAAQMHSI